MGRFFVLPWLSQLYENLYEKGQNSLSFLMICIRNSLKVLKT